MNDEYGTGEQQEEGDLQGQKYKRAGLEDHQGKSVIINQSHVHC